MYIRDLNVASEGESLVIRRLTGVGADTPVVFVGWLGAFRWHATGETDRTFRERLAMLCDSPSFHHRGRFRCRKGRCKLSLHRAEGVGEILVVTAKSVYLAPSLTSHYVTAHRYRPPREFIDAVVRTEGRPAPLRLGAADA